MIVLELYIECIVSDLSTLFCKRLVSQAVPRVGEKLCFGEEVEPEFVVSDVLYCLDTDEGVPHVNVYVDKAEARHLEYLREIGWEPTP